MGFFTKNFSAKKLLKKITYTKIYIFFIVAHIGLIWIFPYFPSQDGPSHIYNLQILHDLIYGGKKWGDYFTYSLEPTPNLGFTLFTYPLLFLVEGITAEKIFLSLYVIFLGISVPLFISTFSKPSFFSKKIKLFAIPVIFNFTLMMGFYSYAIAVPFFLFAISLVWISKNWKVQLKFVCYNSVGIFIFFLHLIPFAYYILALMIFSVVKNQNLRKMPISLVKFLICIHPLIALTIFYISNMAPSSNIFNFSYLLSIDRSYELLSSLIGFSTLSFSPMQILPISALWFSMFLILKEGWKDFSNTPKRTEQKFILILISILATIYCLAPSSFGGGGFFNSRIPWVILILLLPLFSDVIKKPNIVIDFCIIAAAIFSLAINIIIIKNETKNILTFVSGLNFGCSKGDSIMLYKTRQQLWPKIDTILHSPSYYGISNGCVDVGNYQATTNLFPIKFKKNITSVALLNHIENDPISIDFSKYNEISEVIGWDLSQEMQTNLNPFYKMYFSNGNLTLWRRH